MALIRINAHLDKPVLHASPQPLVPVLRSLRRSEGPITIMIHGYTFQPESQNHCPHRHIFSMQETEHPKVPSWPRHLGLHSAGIGIAFGWSARGTLKTALRSAAQACHALATLITLLRQIAPKNPIHLMGHSMGSYLALETLPRLKAGDIGHIVMLNAAAFQSDALKALQSPAGARAHVFNVTSRENNLIDRTYAYALGRTDATLCHGLPAANALTIPLDNTATLDALASIGFPIAPPRHRVCHWSTYLRPGVFPLYKSLLNDSSPITLHQLKQRLPVTAPRPKPRLRAFSLPLSSNPAS
ncbi:alpha/beta fold hydrolase [Shimia abyssi]|uniref:Alpha/beta hydrolase family protein DUF900 n=1 Tax=Shimia abyssi TaxID=1662395 RepID=A0A2P8FAT2_9RHOB|nr:alpha/beta fold hydrolase [Shimia abyssi]PSL18840.1 alpha/beta hydrolase family protein DUF900 [Shimia abyssi]